MKDIFLLDLDDTLLDFSRAERENLRRTLTAYSLPADDSIAAAFHRINEGLWQSLERGEIGREALKVKRFANLLEEFGLHGDAASLSKSYFDGFSDICYPFDGSQAFLKELSSRGRVYLVTNGSACIQYAHIEAAGFAPYLAGVFISEEVGADKPSLKYARYVEAHIPCYERSRAVWIGDSRTSDMVCAKSVGIDFILYLPHTMSNSDMGAAHTYADVLRILGGM